MKTSVSYILGPALRSNSYQKKVQFFLYNYLNCKTNTASISTLNRTLLVILVKTADNTFLLVLKTSEPIIELTTAHANCD